MLEKIKNVMEKAEKFCIILVPIVYILADIFSGFIPALENLTDEKGYLIVLSALMVLIFVHFEKKDREEFKLERSDRIVRDLEILLEEKHSYDEINILAITGYQYFKAFEESGVRVKKLRLLLRKSDNIETIDLPQNADAKREFINSSNKMVKEWKKLQRNGQIRDLDIAFYDFDTTIHFMLLDNKQLFWGLLYPKKDYPGTDVLTSYVINSKSDLGEKMISDFSTKWDKIKQFSD